MLWLLGRGIGKIGSARHRRLVLAACACARLALPDAPKGEDRPRLAIEAAERWARRERGWSVDRVRAAAHAAYAAAHAAYVASHAAAHAAAAYAASAAAAAARAAALAQCADIVREHFPQPPRLTAETGE